jgi:hypothetical protein
MKIEKQIMEFIEMRISGMSFDEIAVKLGVAKSTLIAWNKKVSTRELINEGKVFTINSVIRAYCYDRLSRLKRMLELSKKINEELLKRDLSSTETFKLFQMAMANENQITDMINGSVQIGQNPSLIEVGSDADGFFKCDLDE